MKREYTKPYAEKIEFSYSDQVVASGGNESADNCYWSGGNFYSHSAQTCKDIFHENPSVKNPA